MTENTWPFPDRPGVPLNPDRDGWHWLKTGHGLAPWLWRDDPQSIMWGMGWETNEEVLAPGDIARVPGTTYLGPVLTPEEIAAKDARIAELEAALNALRNNKTEEEALREMMRDPRYWRHRDPEWVNRVRDGFRRLVGGKDE